jgi:hypothetical protein
MAGSPAMITKAGVGHGWMVSPPRYGTLEDLSDAVLDAARPCRTSRRQS